MRRGHFEYFIILYPSSQQGNRDSQSNNNQDDLNARASSYEDMKLLQAEIAGKLSENLREESRMKEKNDDCVDVYEIDQG